MEAVRTFGDDAVPHAGKAPTKVPMFFHSLMGQNFTAGDIAAGGKWWESLGLSDQFYQYQLGYNEDRGVPTFTFAENATEKEEVLAHILFFARKMCEESSDGKPVKDVVVTIHAEATLRQRQTVMAAAEIAGLRPLTLVHETSAFAVQRAVDFTPEKDKPELLLIYNMGSRKTEVTVVKFDSRSAGMVAGKMAPVVSVLGSAIDFGVGGHLMDLKIAQVMLKKFQEKHPKLADGIAKNPRALRKLLSQAQKTKAILSANKNAPFIVESLFEDTDFQTSIKREEFEDMCEDMFARMTNPVDKALAMANVSLSDITQVEVVGGAWRVPKVQKLLGEMFDKGRDKKMLLGQHLNGEEAGAMGAALIAANSSSSFRVKKIFFSDITMHEYAVQVVALKGSWEKNVTTLYPVGSPLGGKKKLSFSLEEDFMVRIFEDGVKVSEYEVTGLESLLEGKWKEYNLTGTPKISATVALELSGILELKTPTASVEESYWVNVTKEKPKPNTTNATNDTAAKEEEPKSEEGAEKSAGESESAADDAAASSNVTANESNETEVEVVLKLKKKKHEKKLIVNRVDFLPKPLSAEEIAALKSKLESMSKSEDDIQAVVGLKNDLEAAIYGSRDKLESEDYLKVSTEEQREEITKLCTEYEEWMYEAGSTKSDYETRLSTLQGLIGPIAERALELESRDGVIESVKDGLEMMKDAQAHIEKNMPWVGSNKTDAAVKKTNEFEEWWKKKQESQKSLPLHEAPAYTKSEVQEKLSKVQKEWEKLKKIKKPKEPKKPKSGKNETKADKTKAEPAEAELPSDPEAVEKMLADVRAEKAKAVENEDFDGAHKLKGKEQALRKHLESLKEGKAEL
eukprot:TRINITY_DN3479_c0_g1_i3.p1 TRINITY_DN3479_c0_g1~~TRINITY_DN3479_c0_g1_i3.p1  ORF type:complete len:929 (+),score=284.08 TRINITY_DN3479_c0_g1_i3:226-2787(+)